MSDAHEKNKNWFVRHKFITALLIIIVLGAVAGAGGSGNKTNSSSNGSTNTSTQPAKAESKAAAAKVGEPARDGKFEFVAKSIKCGVPNVGSEYMTKAAQGQYCLLSVSVKNVGNEAQSLLSSNQYLFNASGQKYSADDTATMYAAPSGASWYSEINPGNTVEGTIVFDLPKDQTPVKAELHDSAFSNGVGVSLNQHLRLTIGPCIRLKIKRKNIASTPVICYYYDIRL